jgi:membrane protease YdiL (CAAX protease family)
VGAGFLAVRRRTGSLAASVAAHLSCNALEVLSSLLGR